MLASGRSSIFMAKASVHGDGAARRSAVGQRKQTLSGFVPSERREVPIAAWQATWPTYPQFARSAGSRRVGRRWAVGRKGDGRTTACPSASFATSASVVAHGGGRVIAIDRSAPSQTVATAPND